MRGGVTASNFGTQMPLFPHLISARIHNTRWLSIQCHRLFFKTFLHICQNESVGWLGLSGKIYICLPKLIIQTKHKRNKKESGHQYFKTIYHNGIKITPDSLLYIGHLNKEVVA